MKKLKVETVFNQNDSEWKNVFLGFNTVLPYTIGGFGCKLCTIATYLKAIGKDVTPLSLNQTFRDKKLFTDENGKVGNGLLADEVVPTVYPDITIHYKSQKYEAAMPDSVIAKIRSLIDSGYLVFAEVDFYPSTVMEDMHFIQIYGYGDNGEFYILDPWTGKKLELSTYGEPARVLYRIWCYDKTIPEETLVDKVITILQSLYGWLVSRATVAKEVAQFLGISDPDNAPTEAYTKSIAGIKSATTACQTQLGTAQSDLATALQEVKNRKEQVERIQQTADASAKLLQAQIDASKAGSSAWSTLETQYKGRIQVLETQMDEASKAKGKALNDLAACQAGKIKATFWDLLRSIFSK